MVRPIGTELGTVAHIVPRALPAGTFSNFKKSQTADRGRPPF